MLRCADILVEIHDGYRDSASRIIRERFAHTHDITAFDLRPRLATEFPKSILVTPSRCAEYLSEGRTIVNNWFWMKSKSNE
jgi:hypothetical protein